MTAYYCNHVMEGKTYWDKFFTYNNVGDLIEGDILSANEDHIEYHKENIAFSKSVAFALDIIDFTSEMLNSKYQTIANQLMKSGTSTGANINEATAAISKKEFIQKMSIASKEARESAYWLYLIDKSEKIDQHPKELISKCNEIIRILTAIIKTSQKSLKHK